MKLYRITAQGEVHGKEIRWAGSQSDAAAARKYMAERGFKRNEVTTTNVDVPTAKAGLLDFLNQLPA